MCSRFVPTCELVGFGNHCLDIIFCRRIITTNTQLAVFIILTAKGRGNFQTIKGGWEQKSLGSPGLQYVDDRWIANGKTSVLALFPSTKA